MRCSHVFFAALIFAYTPVFAAANIGQPAPAFTAQDIAGADVSLDSLKGKIVVLEWNNPGCPFVVKHYTSGNMQALQKFASDEGVTWITINSSAEGKQGNLNPDTAGKHVKDSGTVSSHYILDPEGAIGLLYGAKVTPHMYVIDKEGKLAYAGAIDDKPTKHQSDVNGARNYVRHAIVALKAGKKMEPSVTQAYGCNVKYKR